MAEDSDKSGPTHFEAPCALTRMVSLHIGIRCNNRCAFCRYHFKRNYPESMEMDTSTVIRLLKQARKQGYTGCQFQGGEPTIREDLEKLLMTATDIGFEDRSIVTNGRALYYKDYCLRLVKAGLTAATFSLHGPSPEIHDSLTAAQGSFSQAVTGVRNMQSINTLSGRETVAVSLNSIIVSRNIGHLEGLVALASALHIRSVLFMLYVPPEFKAQQGIAAEAASKELLPDITQLPGIWTALETHALSLGVDIVPFGIPICLTGAVRASGVETTVLRALHPRDIHNGKHRTVSTPLPCNECAVSPFCSGLPHEYIEKFGFHFLTARKREFI